MAGTPVHKRAQGKVRRQYYYSLGATGAEVRLPAIPKIELGWRLASAFLVIVLAAALLALWNAPLFQISKAKIKGAQRIIADDLYAVVDVRGLPVIEASPKQIEADLKEAFPELSSVSVQVGLPASMTITIKERTPLIAWDQDGQTRWIDAEGIAFPVRGETPAGVVVVQAEGAPPAPAVEEPTESEEGAAADSATGETSETNETSASAVPAALAVAAPFLPVDLIQPIIDLSAYVPAGSPIIYSPRYGLGWNDPQGWKVYLGSDLKDLSLKMNEYQVITSKLSGQGIVPSLISLEFLHAPFYRLEP